MKKAVIIFVVFVLLPSLVLAGLALHSLQSQQVIIERQQSVLFQGLADSLAKKVEDYVSEQEREFKAWTDEQLTLRPASQLAANIDSLAQKSFPLSNVGFAVSMQTNTLLSPAPSSQDEVRRTFRREYEKFLCNRETVEVYVGNLRPPNLIDNKEPDSRPQQLQNSSRSPQLFKNGGQQDAYSNLKSEKRVVTPQVSFSAENAVQTKEVQQLEQISKWNSGEAEFTKLIGDQVEGSLSRVLQNKLQVLFWYHPPLQPNFVYGTQIDMKVLLAGLKDSLEVDSSFLKDVVVALLDDNAKPVHQLGDSPIRNIKRPFVAAEVGEALPHWEIALYLKDPAQLTKAADQVKLTFGFLVTLLMICIFAGGWLVVRDVNRQLALARQKTDFVSNVSHELKTPLTSIRMFSELLTEGRVHDESKKQNYLQIISAEAGRLTRLINNVLDFARLERGETKYQLSRFDLQELAVQTSESFRPVLQETGFSFEWVANASPLFVEADKDSISQILTNLLSNAEKYSGETRSITMVASSTGSHARLAVCDRGMGVPSGSEQRIFDQFYRAHDLLSSGIQGSGLGLTLARKMARDQGGDVTYGPRDGGGSIFTLCLPLIKKELSDG